jgi:hypothetical protein
MFAFFSRRLRTWLLFAVALPLVGRLLEGVGTRVAPRNPRAGSTMTSVGRRMADPRGKRAARRR